MIRPVSSAWCSASSIHKDCKRMGLATAYAYGPIRFSSHHNELCSERGIPIESIQANPFAACLSGLEHCRFQHPSHRHTSLSSILQRTECTLIRTSIRSISVFHLRSFLIMAVMMTGGIYLRASGLAPERFIAGFYTGLGAALLLAGILFGIHYINEPQESE